MKTRLALLFVALGLVVAAAAYVQVRVAPSVVPAGYSPAPAARRLSAADKAKLKVLQDQFMHERDEYLKLKNAGAAPDKIQAQWERVTKAVEAVQALGGTEAIKTLPVSEYAPVAKNRERGKGGDSGPR